MTNDDMHKMPNGAWSKRNGDWLFTVTVEGNRVLTWARHAAEAVDHALWEKFTRRNRKRPAEDQIAVRFADDDEAASLLRRRPSKTVQQSGPSLLDGYPTDPALSAMLDSPGLVRHDAPSTSRKAARTVKTGSKRHQVLAMIDRAGSTGLTDEEMQATMSANTQRPRRVELADAGYIKAAAEVRSTKAGVSAQVWVITAEGERVLAACDRVAEGP